MMLVFNVLRFLAGFGVARALLFVGPILLSNLLPLDRYGQFELAQSYAAIGALVVGLGLVSTVPLIRLRNEIEGRWDSLLLLLALLGGGCLLTALALALGLSTLYTVPVLAGLTIGTFMLQNLWAVYLKSAGRATGAVFVEAGLWSVAVAGAGLIILSGGRLPYATIPLALLAYGLSLLAFTVIQFRCYRAAHALGGIALPDLRRNIALGLPLMLTGLLAGILTSSGRLILGSTAGVEGVALYAVLYRSTTLPLVGHQLLIIGFFRQLFLWSDDLLRARAPVIVLGVGGMVVAFWLLEPHLGWLLGQRFEETFATYRAEGLTLLVQTILWSAIALNDLINSRLQIAGRVTLVTAPYLATSLSALTLWTWSRAQALPTETLLYDFIFGHFVVMAGFYLLQCLAVWRLGHHFIRLWGTVAACTAGAGTIIFLGELLR